MLERLTTVTTAASTQDLTTLAIVKSELGIATLDTSHDALLARYISAESAKIAGYCNRVFPHEHVTEVFRVDQKSFDFGPSALSLSHFPEVTITSVTENDDTALSSSDYEVDSSRGLLFRLSNGSRSYWPFGRVTVVYLGGYATIPVAIDDACVQLVKIRYASESRDPNLKSEYIEGVIRTDYFDGSAGAAFPTSIAELLAPYREFSRG